MNIDRSLFNDVGSLRLVMHGVAAGTRQGDRRSPHRGRGVEFADYRAYSPGDDLRLVDWNVYSRLQSVLVRLFHEDRNLSVRVCLDASASMAFGDPRKIDHAGNLAAALALVALLNRDTVALGVSAGEGPKMVVRGQNTKAFPQILHLLERTEAAGDASVKRDLTRLRAGTKADRMFFVSDMLYPPDDVENVLRVLSASAQSPVLLHVLALEELEPDLRHARRVVDSETGEELFVRGGRQAARDYQAALTQWLDALEDRCDSLRVQYVPAFTTAPVRTLFTKNLRESRVVESLRGAR